MPDGMKRLDLALRKSPDDHSPGLFLLSSTEATSYFHAQFGQQFGFFVQQDYQHPQWGRNTNFAFLVPRHGVWVRRNFPRIRRISCPRYLAIKRSRDSEYRTALPSSGLNTISLHSGCEHSTPLMPCTSAVTYLWAIANERLVNVTVPL